MLIADDDAFVRRFFGEVVERAFPDAEVVAVGDAAAAITAARASQPELALLDFRMPGGGPMAARGIHATSPRTRVLAISGSEDVLTVREMLSAGASTFLVKGMPLDDLIEALRTAMSGPGDREPGATSIRSGIRVIVVEPDGELLEAIADVLERAPGVQLVGIAQTMFHATSLAAQDRPDVALVASDVPPGGVGRVAAALASASPQTRVIELRQPGSEVDLRESVGSVGDGDDLVAAIHHVASGVAGAGAPVMFDRRLGGTGASLRSRRRRFERLQAVLRRDRLDIVIQPIVALADARLCGYEALTRFPGHPSPSPDVWFAEAHRAGAGVELELLAVRSALLELSRFPPGAFLAVNVSPETVLAGELDQLVAEHAPRLVLELTEHAPVHDYTALQRRLDSLRALGVRIAVDDCGAGFASLRHVAMLTPDFLKLDIFLCQNVREPVRAALARALVAFAADSGILAVAEGIEAPDDLDALRELGVPLGQGYLLARPVPPNELLAN